MADGSMIPQLGMPPPRKPPQMSGGAVDIEKHMFVIPTKQLSNPADMPKWEKSEAYRDLMGFILAMSESVKGKAISDTPDASETVQRLLAMLESMTSWVAEIPPVEQPARFGNKAYRDWYSRMDERAESELETVLGEKLKKAAPELAVYLRDSFGNSTRIDYGTGHEMAFAALLCCLFKVGALTQADSQAVILRVFQRYMELCRLLQQSYRMEPAGSHGVWSLDDYQFLPFLWGSAQLINHPRLEPRSFVEEETITRFAKDYMFLDCIKYINSVKTGPFHEHSNQLWNISGVQMWSKVNSGLVKMYKAEVLAKFPVIQHFYFGSLMTLKFAGV